MGYAALLLLGGLVGMQHALEADHLAAMAAISTHGSSRRTLVLRGMLWGVGHTITLLAICGVLLLWGGTIPPRLEAGLEILVGVMIVALGAQVLLRLWRAVPPANEHEDRTAANSDAGLRRAVAIGMMHGTAGSGGLLVLAAAAGSLTNSMGYVLAFGIGSIIGMATLSFVASFPLGLLGSRGRRLNDAATMTIGVAAVIVGLRILTRSWGAL